MFAPYRLKLAVTFVFLGQYATLSFCNTYQGSAGSKFFWASLQFVQFDQISCFCANIMSNIALILNKQKVQKIYLSRLVGNVFLKPFLYTSCRSSQPSFIIKIVVFFNIISNIAFIFKGQKCLRVYQVKTFLNFIWFIFS